jgi:glutamyl-tRNA reductase
MDIVVVGMNHRSAPLEVREKLAFAKHSLCGALCNLKDGSCLWECGIISTCNRVEVYGVAEECDSAVQAITRFLSGHSAQPQDFFQGSLYIQKQPESIRHIFRVASGLDAMMVGEKEIVAQVKEAYDKAREAQSAGRVLNALFQRALRVSKRVRTETRIDVAEVSVSSAAVELAKKIFGNLADNIVMIIGAGETSEQTLKHLVASGAGSIVASNRSFEKAQELARAYNGKAVRLDHCVEELAHVDVVISSTAAPRAIIGKGCVRQAMRKRRNRPLFLIDIAVPRDIAPEVNELDNVYLYNIDDLKEIAQSNLHRREEEIIRGERIVNEEVSLFMGWLNSLQASPVIRKLHEHFESVREEEMHRALSKLPELPGETRQEIEAMTRRMIKRLLHTPTTRIKKAAGQKDSAAVMTWLTNLFGLDDHKKDEK